MYGPDSPLCRFVLNSCCIQLPARGQTGLTAWHKDPLQKIESDQNWMPGCLVVIQITNLFVLRWSEPYLFVDTLVCASSLLDVKVSGSLVETGVAVKQCYEEKGGKIKQWWIYSQWNHHHLHLHSVTVTKATEGSGSICLHDLSEQKKEIYLWDSFDC